MKEEFFLKPTLEFRRDEEGHFQLQFVHIQENTIVPWCTFAYLHEENAFYYNVVVKERLRGFLDIDSEPNKIYSEEKAWDSSRS